MDRNSKHIVVAGSGLVGLASAARLAQAQYRVTLTGEIPLEFDHHNRDLRVYALNTKSCDLLRGLGVWKEIEQRRAYPYSAMHVWDQEGGSKLDFYATDLGLPALGVIAEDALLRNVLFESLKKNPQVEICCPATIVGVEQSEGIQRITLSDERVLNANLVVGADGAHSWVRRRMEVFWQYTDYRQTAIVANVKHELSHQNACWQRFYQPGVLALLPLSENHGSIVWSCNHVLAAELTAATSEDFTACLVNVFQDRFGKMELDSERVAFPLFGGCVDRYVQEGFVLVGDAAHHIHPLAGQGANMGLADVVALANALSGDVPSLAKLRRYERSVKERNFAMKTFLEGLLCVFTERRRILGKIFCTYGMNTVNRYLLIKTWFMRRALG